VLMSMVPVDMYGWSLLSAEVRVRVFGVCLL